MEFIQISLSIISHERKHDFIAEYEKRVKAQYKHYFITNEEYQMIETLKQLRDDKEMALEYALFKLPEVIKSFAKYDIFKDKSKLVPPGLLPLYIAERFDLKEVVLLLFENGVEVDCWKEYNMHDYERGFWISERRLTAWNEEIEKKRQEARKWVKPAMRDLQEVSESINP